MRSFPYTTMIVVGWCYLSSVANGWVVTPLVSSPKGGIIGKSWARQSHLSDWLEKQQDDETKTTPSFHNSFSHRLPRQTHQYQQGTIQQFLASALLSVFLVVLGPLTAQAGTDDATASSSSSATEVIEQTWSLVDKFYEDRSFGGQDWNQVHQKYLQLADHAGDEQALKLVTTMVESLHDKYSRILDPKAYAAIQKYDLIGVGVALMPNDSKEIIVGSPPIPGSAADQAGLQVGDRVVAINGVDTAGRTAFDIVDQISENPNAETVVFRVQRQSSSEPAADIVLQRQFQKVSNPIQYKVAERRSDGTVVGYVRIVSFNSLVKPKLEQALKDLKSDGVNAFVLDLRQNTGGAFQTAVDTSSMFVPDRVATYVIDSKGVQLPFRTASDRLLADRTDPVVIWMDGRTASASEVLAGSLHDNCRAVLMGSPSFGKGLIQAVYGLPNGAGLVLTVAQYVTPSGTSIQGVGLTPDVPDDSPGGTGAGGVLSLPPMMVRLSSDTTKVDFGDIRDRLAMCKLPEER